MSGFSGNMRHRKTLLLNKTKTARSLTKRGQFVSFSASGVRQQKSKCTKTAKEVKRTPSNKDIWAKAVTNKDTWKAFYSNGRPKFRKGCNIMCIVEFDSTDTAEQFWESSYSHQRDNHAEVKVLRRIKEKELRFGFDAR
jgi:hypothetical protein